MKNRHRKPSIVVTATQKSCILYQTIFFRLVYFSSGNGLLLPISACRVVVALPDPLLLIDSLLPAETAAVSVAVTEVEAVPAEVT